MTPALSGDPLSCVRASEANGAGQAASASGHVVRGLSARPPSPARRPSPMHPSDLASERERRLRRAYKAVARDARQACLNATDEERLLLDQVTIACQTRAIGPDEAHRHVAAIRDQQRDRHLRDAHSRLVELERRVRAA